MDHDLDGRVSQMMLLGACCTQVQVQLALDESGRGDPLLVSAVAPLCGGLGVGSTCGALSGGLLVLSLLNDDRVPDAETAGAFIEWFRERFGSTDCRDIVSADPLERGLRCPPLVAAAYVKARDLAGRQEDE